VGSDSYAQHASQSKVTTVPWPYYAQHPLKMVAGMIFPGDNADGLQSFVINLKDKLGKLCFILLE